MIFPSGWRAPAIAVSLFSVLALFGQGCGDSGPDCKNGQVACGSACVDIATNPYHCGSCQGANSVCARGAACTAGVCHCPSGQIPCNHKCIDPLTDATNCNGCGNDCGYGTCSNGACTCSSTPATVLECTGANPLCVDTATDAKHCGDCDTACTLSSEICEGSQCKCPSSLPDQCPEGTPTACVNKASDKKNCGTCGTVCGKTNEQCIDSACKCPTAYPTACPTSDPTACVNTDTDSKNCGTCGHACTSPLTCVDGECKGCASPSTNCSGTCIDTRSDRDHCGSCTNVCPVAASCSSSTCVCPKSAPACGDEGCCQGGTQCCGTGSSATCPLAHSNGLGKFYYDCAEVETYNATTAAEAAASWAPSGSQGAVSFSGCLSWTNGSQCAVWCYGTYATGLVHLNTGSTDCVQPIPGVDGYWK